MPTADATRQTTDIARACRDDMIDAANCDGRASIAATHDVLQGMEGRDDPGIR
jgi:hypothetical protein